MSKKPSPYAVFIIGTGRSGTSLATQVLDNLGLMMPDDLVPASENNLRGTGESIAVRDHMVALSAAFGVVSAGLPSDWQSHPASIQTGNWIEGYLTRQRDKAENNGFVIKFPMASIFLPLWIDAAARIELDLRFLWATRNPADTFMSLKRSYKQADMTAQLRIAQRCFYILRDAPPETLLLPYEGWADTPLEQRTTLTALTRFTNPNRLEKATRAFSTMLKSNTPQSVEKLPEAFAMYDEVICRKNGRLRDILPQGSVEHEQMMLAMADLIHTTQSDKSPIHFLDAMNVRLSLLSRMAATSDTETPEMKAELEILAERVREVNKKNSELERHMREETAAPQAATLQQPVTEVSKPSKKLKKKLKKQAASAKAARKKSKQKIADLRQQLKLSQAAHEQLEAQAQANDTRAIQQEIEAQTLKVAYATLTREKDALEEDINARAYVTIRALERNEARLQTQLVNLQKRFERTSAKLKAAEEK